MPAGTPARAPACRAKNPDALVSRAQLRRARDAIVKPSASVRLPLWEAAVDGLLAQGWLAELPSDADKLMLGACASAPAGRAEKGMHPHPA